jgi:hypothetical protein
MRMKNISILMFLLVIVLLCASCVPGDGTNTTDDPAGFFWGIWHGWIAPISLIIGFFNPEIHIYETFNSGWWYDFGFYIAIIGGFGGFSFLRKRSKRKS